MTINATWQHELDEALLLREQQGLRRRLHAVSPCDKILSDGHHEVLNFSSNDYLALAKHPHVITSVAQSAQAEGVGAGASRLISGTLESTEAFEKRFASFKHAEAALVLPTGYMANHAALTAMACEKDLILFDKLSHASLIDAARASEAVIRSFPHLNYKRLEQLLSREVLRGVKVRRRIIVTDSVFSMDGDVADLRELVRLRDLYDAILVVDEAHGTGVLGQTGAGLAEAQGVGGQIDITISTGGKALGSLGGIITAEQRVIDTIVNHSRSAIYTTAVPPTQVAALNAAVDVIEREPERRVVLQELSKYIKERLKAENLTLIPANAGRDDGADWPTPIVPVLIADPVKTERVSMSLIQQGCFAPAIRTPTVAPGAERLRISLRSDLTRDEIDVLVDAVIKGLKDQ